MKLIKTEEKYKMSEKKTLTTAHGSPVADNQNSLTVGPRGPLLMQDYQLLEKMATFNRERVPERVVHAKGSGAFGTLTITNDITQYSKRRCFLQLARKQMHCLDFQPLRGNEVLLMPKEM